VISFTQQDNTVAGSSKDNINEPRMSSPTTAEMPSALSNDATMMPASDHFSEQSFKDNSNETQ
jgi:hypothetical protein